MVERALPYLCPLPQLQRLQWHRQQLLTAAEAALRPTQALQEVVHLAALVLLVVVVAVLVLVVLLVVEVVVEWFLVLVVVLPEVIPVAHQSTSPAISLVDRTRSIGPAPLA